MGMCAQPGAGALEQNERLLIPTSSRGAVRCSPAPPPPQGTAGHCGSMQGLLLCGGWLLAAGYVLGGCRHRCCPGRNNACWATGARRTRCYCDSYCERTGDCCQDYQAACRRAGEPRGRVRVVGPFVSVGFRRFRQWREALPSCGR